MARHDVIVVGASAGGVEALIRLVGGLPADLPAAVCVVLHLPQYGPSHLPAILARAGPLPAAQAAGSEPIAPGRIYIAPPDYHLLVRQGRVEISHGPRENRARPAVDPLFRSAARAYGARVVGVVLSGALGDGAMGLAAVAARGGVTVVQDPDEALFDGMPRAALRSARVNHMLPVQGIPPLLIRLAREQVAEKGWQSMSEIAEESAPEIGRDIVSQARDARGGETTVFTCPECGGTLWQIEEGNVTQFNCHVGHTFSPEILLGQMSEELEAALWMCVRMLVEKATLTRQLAHRLRASGQAAQAARVEEQAQLNDRQGKLIRDTLLEAPETPSAQTLTVGQALEDSGGTQGVSRD
jgi:two-component system chemotaxis response regulator CheB